MITAEFLITALVVVLIPGTGVIYTLSTGLFQGAKASVAAAAGCTVGIIPSLIACILGLAAVIHTSALVFQVIKFAGVAYLLYLAWSMWKSTGAMVLEGSDRGVALWNISLKGFLINILNPKLSLFFLAFLPQFIPAQAEAPMINMLVLGGVFMALTLIVFMGYGLLANRLSHYIVNSPTAVQRVQHSFAGLFALLGARLALTER